MKRASQKQKIGRVLAILIPVIFLLAIIAGFLGSSYKKQDLIKKAENGDVDALFMLGKAYAFGKGGVRQDYFKARELFSKAASLGDARSKYQLVGFYRKGLGGRSDVATADRLLKEAGAQDHVQALFDLGHKYSSTPSSILREPDKAVNYYGRLCDLGHQKGCDEYARVKSFLK